MTWEEITNKGYTIHHDGGNNYTITEGVKADTCPHCQARFNLESKGFKTRTVTEIIEGKLVKIEIKKRKYLCHSCDSQHAPQDIFPPKIRYGPEYRSAVLQYMIESDDRTLDGASNQYKISKTAIDGILKECRENLAEQIEQLEISDNIILYPYTYNNVKRCFIMGIDYRKKKTYLFMVLNQYDGSEIVRFLEKRSVLPFDSDAFEAIYLDLNKSVYQALEEYVGEDPLVIPKALIEKTADDLRLHVERFDSPILLLDDFDRITRKEMSFAERIKKWEKWCDDAVQSNHEVMINFGDTVRTCIQACVTGLMMEEKNCFFSPEIERLMSIVDRFQKCNCSFDMMTFRLLFTNPSVYGLLSDGTEGRMKIMTFVPDEKYCGFAIDIAELVTILEQIYP